jgi:hypothetical protein
VPGIYRPRHPERTVLYRILFHNFDRFLTVYEGRFEKEYGHFRPVVKEVVERYLDCGNPRGGFARISCPDCHSEHLLTFSCKTRGFRPSCHAKRREEWGRSTSTRIFISRVRARTKTEAERIGKYMVRPVLALDRLSFLEGEGRVGYRHGDDDAELERMDYLELIARVTSHVPDKGKVMVRYYGLYASAQIHPSPGVDVRRGKAAAGSCLRTDGPDGGRRERGVRITAPGRGGRTIPAWPNSRLAGPIIRLRWRWAAES